MDHSERVGVTRQDLYDRIWSMPVSRACRLYGLSDVGLAKICADWDIPRPPRGYWEKKRHGHPVRPQKLPPIEQGNPVIFSYRPRPADEPEPNPEPTETERRRAFEKLPENQIAVSDRLTDPHPLVARTGTSIRSARPDDVGIARPEARKCLDLAVSPGLIDRSLRILDALLKALESRGLAVSVTGSDQVRTQVRVLGEDIGFQLYEEAMRQERLPTPHEIAWELRFRPDRKFYTTVPSGRLVLRITNGAGLQRCWTDRSDRWVEQFLNSFVVGVFRAAESIKQQRNKAAREAQEREERERHRREDEQRREAERKEQERLRQEEERRRQEEEARVRKLEADAANWAKARQIRAYLAAVRQVTTEPSGPVVAGTEFDHWLQWAEAHADAIDPLVQRRRPRSTASDDSQVP